MGVCAIIAHSPLHDPEFVKALEEKVRRGLRVESAVEKCSSPRCEVPRDCDGYVLVIATGGTEAILLSMMEALTSRPVVALAHDVANSLPAFIEAIPLMKQKSGQLSYLFSSFEEIDKAAEKAARALKSLAAFKRSRLGLIGGISEWLVYSKTDPEVVKQRLGAELVYVPFERLREAYESVVLEGREEVERIAGTFSSTVPVAEIERAYRLDLALNKIVMEESLSGFTVKCFDAIREFGTTACLGVSLFNSKLLTAGCEGDVPTFLSMHALSLLSGKPAFMGNPSAIRGNRFLIAHCTAPIAMSADRPVLKTHFESGIGVGVAITFPRGEATFLKLAPDLSRARIFRGRVVEGRPLSERHCRSQAWVEVDFDPSLLVRGSMGNHYAFVMGDYVEDARMLMELLGIEAELP